MENRLKIGQRPVGDHLNVLVWDRSAISRESFFSLDRSSTSQRSSQHFDLGQVGDQSGIILLIWKSGLKPGLHTVVRIAEHACNDASKRILMFSAHRLQIFLVRDQCL